MRQYILLISLCAAIAFSFDAASAQWKRIDQLTGRSVYCFAADSTTIFAGSDNGQIFVSTDNGDSWSIDSILGHSAPVITLALSGDTIIAGTKTDGIYLSVNNGATWTYNGLAGTELHSLLFQDAVMYAGTKNGVLRSKNFGVGWDTIMHGHETDVLLQSDSSTLFAGDFITIDKGKSWTRVTCSEESPLFLFKLAGGIYSVSQNSICFSSNRGISWSPVSLKYNSFVGGTSNDSLIVLANIAGVIIGSDKSGKYWNEITGPLKQNSIVGNGLLFLNKSKLFYASSLGAWSMDYPVIYVIDTTPIVYFYPSFSVFPNPTPGILTVSYQQLELESVTIFDVLGREILEIPFPAPNIQTVTQSAQFDISTLTRGTYYLRINQRTNFLYFDSDVATPKIVKIFKE
jgi:hypothetical protein